MGMFDYVHCELPIPDGRKVLKDSFQTKSLWCSMDRFTITTEGRLIYHKHRYTASSDANPSPPTHVADMDMGYHGDMELYGAMPDGTGVCYAVRFTHGAVEWIRPFEELPETHQHWIIERGR